MLRHRMWLVLLGYVAVAAAMACRLATGRRFERGIAPRGVHARGPDRMEAGTLRHFTLGGRGWRNVGTIVGRDRDTVRAAGLRTRRCAATAGTDLAGDTARGPAAPRLAAIPGTDVIGLFPQPGARQ